MAMYTGPARGRRSGRTAPTASTRHPLVAVAMVLPLAVLLAVALGGWENLVVQVSLAAELMGR